MAPVQAETAKLFTNSSLESTPTTCLLTISDADDSFLVSTPELPSLHLTRKAVAYLGGIGFPPDRYRVVVNRVNKQEGIASEDMAKIFGAPVYATFPNDYMALH